MKKNTLAGIVFTLTGLATAITSVNYGISSYEYFKKGETKTYLQDYNPDYNASIANGAISLIMGTSAISCCNFAKRRFSKKED